MRAVWTRTLCRLLAALMVWTPMQVAQAGMIGTGEAAASSITDRAAVLGFIGRAEVARELQALGLDAATAQERVAALTDRELASIADSVRGLPAGADAGGILAWIILIWALWYIYWRKPSPNPSS
jgi:hypothetical protein